MDDAALVARGQERGHRVMVTPLGPSWVVECPCGALERRTASKRAANLLGLNHLRARYALTLMP